MSLKRYAIDIFFLEPISIPMQNRINAWVNATKGILSDTAVINAGQPNEEKPRTKVHTCRHDVNQPCDPEVDI